MRLREGGLAGIVGFAAWCACCVVDHLAGHRWVQPTHGVALYLGAMVAAAVLVFLGPLTGAARRRLAWTTAAIATTGGAVSVATRIDPTSLLRAVPGCLAHEVPASALGVLLLLVAAGDGRIHVGPASRPFGAQSVRRTTLRCTACLLLLLAGVTHAAWALSSVLGSPRYFFGWVLEHAVGAQICVASLLFLHLLVMSSRHARSIFTLFGLGAAVLTCSSVCLAGSGDGEAIAFACVVCACVAVAIARVGLARPEDEAGRITFPISVRNRVVFALALGGPLAAYFGTQSFAPTEGVWPPAMVMIASFTVQLVVLLGFALPRLAVQWDGEAISGPGADGWGSILRLRPVDVDVERTRAPSFWNRIHFHDRIWSRRGESIALPWLLHDRATRKRIVKIACTGRDET